MSIRITASERVLFVGATGSGKTQLAKKLIAPLRRIVVIDPKHTFHAQGFKVQDSIRFWQRKEFRIITRPFRGHDEKLRDLVEAIYDKGDATIYVDEISSLADRFPKTLETLEDIARTGREKMVSLWTTAQRPRWIPRIFLTETESYFIFNLRSAEDRDTIAGFVGNEIFQTPLNPHQFFYCRADANTPAERMKLDLKTGTIYSLGKEVTQNA